MLYLFQENGDRIPWAYNGLTVNSPTDPRDDTYEINAVSIDDQWDGAVEPKVQTHGLEGYRPRKVSARIRADGVIRAPSLKKLFDKVLILNAAFDMVNAYNADTSTVRNRGYLALTGSLPTDDLDNYPTNLIPVQYFVRSLRKPVSRTSQFEGLTCRFTLILEAADPRMYFQTLQSASRVNAGTLVLNNSLAKFPSWPTVTIDLSGTGSGRVSLATAQGTVVADLTGSTSTDLYVIDMENHEVRLNGSVAMQDLVSAGWWELLPTSDTLTVGNMTGTLAGTVTVEWRRAFT